MTKDIIQPKVRTQPWPVWDVAVVCEDHETEDHAEWLLREIRPDTGINVKCHTHALRLGKVPALGVLHSALQEAGDADLVIACTHGSGGVPSDGDELFGNWLSMAGGQLCPVIVVLHPNQESDSYRNEILTALQRLREHPDNPFFTSFSDALLAAWDRWRWKAWIQSRNG